MPKFRWKFQITVTNRLGREITAYWYGLSFGPVFIGLIKGHAND